jgi:hypothetical protein
VSSSRRSFLQFAGLAPVAAAAGTLPADARAAGAEVASLTRSAFARCVGESFVFETDAIGECAAKLVRVEAVEGVDRD